MAILRSAGAITASVRPARTSASTKPSTSPSRGGQALARWTSARPVKMVKHKAEDFKVSIRNERRDAKELLEEAQKEGDVSEDDVKKAQEKVQKETDDGVKQVDAILAAKEKDVMQI